jgi:hypothetical protein
MATPRGPVRTLRLLPLLVALAAGGAVSAQVPPHLDILSATIEELPPIDRENVPGRGVALRLVVSGAPPCHAGTGVLAYGFLVDADSDPATGLTGVPFDDLGVEARLTATCDPVSGFFWSPLGTVTLTPGTGTTTIEIRTTVERLPSLGFRWVAYAEENATFSRLPQSPEYAYWTTFEKGVF